MADWLGFVGLFWASFLFNIIPFAGPSNLLIAANISLLVEYDPVTIGLAVALGAATAKSIHYVVTFFLSGFIGQDRRKRLNATAMRLNKWAMIAVFVVAATPVPDEPVIVPLGILKYNPVKLFASYFAGKLLIAALGAYLARLGQNMFAGILSSEAMIAISIVLTVVLTILLFKVDIVELAERIFKRKLT